MNQLQLQPSLNIGMIGSVSNGKSTITQALTGIKTQKYAKEQERNITIKLGYANAKIFKCSNCQPPMCYQSSSSFVMELNCKYCNNIMELKKHISIIDTPGHNMLMATMINGTSVMDTTILVESSVNNGLEKQSVEHLAALSNSSVPNSIVCLNKMDLCKKIDAHSKIEILKESLKKTKVSKSPIIPISANFGINIDLLCEHICQIQENHINEINELKMIIIRSFNVNKPDTKVDNLSGGVIGGTICSGSLKIGDTVKLIPGFILKQDNKWSYCPLNAIVNSINSETNNLDFATTGGLIGVGLDIDPGLAAKDGLIGNLVISNTNNKWAVYEEITIFTELFDNITISLNEKLIVNCNAMNKNTQVINKMLNMVTLKFLDGPICVTLDKNKKLNDSNFVSLSRTTGNNIQLIGKGIIKKGIKSKIIV